MKFISFDVPILFIIFNRPNVTQVVFNRIKEIKPKYLFVAADGPRKNVISDNDNCKKTREIINQVDWDCQVKTLFRDENLGCGKGVKGAIDCFFEYVEQGIILEDDCLPDISFFQFTKLMLEKYKNEEKVKMIAGTNYLFNKVNKKESYYFSKYFSIWGWATWKRAWIENDFDLKSWPQVKSSGILKKKFNFKKNVLNKFWTSSLNSVLEERIDTWDYQWAYSCLINNGFSIVPVNNLVSNLGTFGVHSNGDKTFINMPVRSINVENIIHPKNIKLDKKLDKLTYKNIGITKFNLREKLWIMRFAFYKLLKKNAFYTKIKNIQ